MRAVLALTAAALYAQSAGPQLVREGKLEEALAAFRAELETTPKSVAAFNGAGVVLDLMGRYPEAQGYFAQAIKSAKTPLQQATANRAMVIAHGFAGDCKGAEKYEGKAFEFYYGTSDFYNAGEAADELGRICLDSGELDRASDWYRKGYTAGIEEPNLSQARRDLWNFRLTHARARIAARRGKPQDAQKLVREARTLLDRGNIRDQEQYFPYLSGYVAFYAGDYAKALTDLQLAGEADPFIQCLIAQTYEAMGDSKQAMEHYRQAASTTAHSVPAAYARPFATRKLR
jgi:tetratricopeptide (TPR) repeat protein